MRGANDGAEGDHGKAVDQIKQGGKMNARIYPYKNRFAVMAGDKPGFGDTIWDTVEQAEKEIAFQAKKAEWDKQAAIELDARLAREAAIEAAIIDLDGYEGDLPPMKLGRVRATLTTMVLYSGRPISRRDLIRLKVSDGWIVTSHGLEAPDGVYLSEKALTKTGLDYAGYLVQLNTRRNSGKQGG